MLGRGRSLKGALVALLLGCNTGSGAEPGAPLAEASTSPIASSPVKADGAYAEKPQLTREIATADGMKWVKVRSARIAAATDLPLVRVTESELSVGNTLIAPVLPGPLGFDAALKRAGNRAALQVLPLEAALRPRHALSPSQNTIRVLVDARASYRTAFEVLFTCAQAGFTSFELIVASDGHESALPASTPSKAERAAGLVTPSFVLDTEGVTLSVGQTPMGVECALGKNGRALPARSGIVDPTAATRCASRLKTLKPEWSNLDVANVSASPGLDMEAVLTLVAAILPSFPTIHFGLTSG